MRRPIAAAREQKAALLNILLTAILCGLGVNLATAYLSNQLQNSTSVLLCMSLTTLLVAGLLIVRLFASHSRQVIRLTGALAFEVTRHDIIPVRIIGYPFNDDLCQYLRAFLRENEAYARLFFETDRHEVRRTDSFDPDTLDYYSIINSVLEFSILRKLDLQLNSYFTENEIDRSRITTISREQLDPGVLKNRVIDLITRDMKEREAFMRHSERQTEGIVYMAPGKGGAIYERLDIELPPKSRIHRDSKGHIVISCKFFDLTIWPQFEGFVTSISQELMPSKTKYCAPLLVALKLVVQIKNLAFISHKSTEMYEWLDSFIDDLTEYVSTDKLEQRLDTDVIELMKSQQGAKGT